MNCVVTLEIYRKGERMISLQRDIPGLVFLPYNMGGEVALLPPHPKLGLLTAQVITGVHPNRAPQLGLMIKDGAIANEWPAVAGHLRENGWVDG